MLLLPGITNLATTAALSTVENKTPSVSDLVKKADYDAKISVNTLLLYYFITSDYNKFTSNTLDAKLKQKKLINECDLNGKTKALTTKEEIKTLATKAELKSEGNKIVNETYDLSILIAQSYFNNDGSQN